eukprot:gene11433-21634_t
MADASSEMELPLSKERNPKERNPKERASELAFDTSTFIIKPKSGLERLGIEYRGYCYKINSNGTFIQRTAGPETSLEIVLFLNVSDGMSISSRQPGDSVEGNIQETLRSENYASCGCRLPCNEIRFRKSASFSEWPSTRDLARQRVSLSLDMSLDESNLTEKFVRDNFIVINVFFGDMEY